MYVFTKEYAGHTVYWTGTGWKGMGLEVVNFTRDPKLAYVMNYETAMAETTLWRGLKEYILERTP